MSALLLSAMVLAACAPATSDVSVSDAWARAATAAVSESGESAGMESATPAMDMTTPAADTSATPAADTGSGGMDMSTDSTGGVSAAYMTITNSGGAADRLVSVSTDVAGVAEIHTSQVDSSGVVSMQPLPDGLEIPANGSVTLAPGGYHIMLMDLQRNLDAGDSITLDLMFASGKTLTVEAEIRPPQ